MQWSGLVVIMYGQHSLYNPTIFDVPDLSLTKVFQWSNAKIAHDSFNV